MFDFYTETISSTKTFQTHKFSKFDRQANIKNKHVFRVWFPCVSNWHFLNIANRFVSDSIVWVQTKNSHQIAEFSENAFQMHGTSKAKHQYSIDGNSIPHAFDMDVRCEREQKRKNACESKFMCYKFTEMLANISKQLKTVKWIFLLKLWQYLTLQHLSIGSFPNHYFEFTQKHQYCRFYSICRPMYSKWKWIAKK